MVGHVKTLGWIGIVRALLGGALAGFLLYSAGRVGGSPDARPSDPFWLTVVGSTLIVFALLHLIQGIGALKRKRWARRVGTGLGVVDLAALIFFPLSTALGLYALVTYRHPDTLDGFGEGPGGDRSSGRKP